VVTQSLRDAFPGIAAEADGWDPGTVSHASARKLRWRCPLGHTYLAAVYSRTAGTGCPVCSGRRVLPGFNDVLSQFPDVAAEADGWDPGQTLKGTHAKRSWRCPSNHTYDMAVTKRVAGQACPYCSGNRVWVGYNDLATLRPDLAKEAHEWDPRTVTVRSGLKREWKCDKSHVYEMRVADRTERNRPEQGCPFCSGKRVLVGFNDLFTTDPLIAAQADGWDPRLVTRSSNKTQSWQCGLGHQWNAAPNSRTNARLRSGCPVCAGQQVLAGFNDLATTHPDLAAQADGWDPTTVTAGSGRKYTWRCELGHAWSTDPAHRTGKVKRGCPSCAVPGYDPNREGWLYLLEDPQRGLMQIGISNVPEQRLARHRSNGWLLVELLAFDGDVAYRWEQLILEALRSRGIGLPRHRGGGFDGYTETWERAAFPVSRLEPLMRLVSD
jgi:Probable Zinc-ribbon domain